MRTEFEIQLAVATSAGEVNDWRTREGAFDSIFPDAVRRHQNASHDLILVLI